MNCNLIIYKVHCHRLFLKLNNYTQFIMFSSLEFLMNSFHDTVVQGNANYLIECQCHCFIDSNVTNYYLDYLGSL